MTLTEHQIRLQKRQQLIAAGIPPYANYFHKTHSTADLIKLADNYNLPSAEILMENGAENSYSTAGRVMTFRSHGKLSFITLQDEFGEIQLAFVKDQCKLIVHNQKILETISIDNSEISAYKFVEKYIDIADFIGAKGELFITKHGELTLFVNEFQLLSKALRPLGDKRHGIQDDEIRLRKRYLDTTMNRDTFEMLHRRSRFWQSIRSFLLSHHFLEVETPVLEVTTGGGDANPFVTHHNALDIDVFLRISAGELRQKRLLVGGFEKTFEIGRIFRNEGMSPEHAQDYTQMENYRAYTSFKEMMQFIKDMYLHIVDSVYHKRVFDIRGHRVDFNQEREEIDFTAIILEKTGIDIWKATEQEIENTLDALGVKYEPQNRIRLIDTLWKYCRKQISGPAFLINEPKFISPLAKSSWGNPEITERFHIILAGSEVGNGFSELNDPIDQQERFEVQQSMREAGDEEAQMADREYIEALEHGMPPAAGFGVSERLFCFLENLPIREAQYFPLIKPESIKPDDEGKSKETKLAVALVNTGMDLELRQEMNTIAHLTAAMGARKGKELFLQDTITTQDNTSIKLNIQHAIMIKEIDSSNTIRKLIQQAKEKGLEIAEFTREMMETTDDRKVIEQTKQKSFDDIEYLGVLVFGNKKDIEEITASYRLYDGSQTKEKEVGVLLKQLPSYDGNYSILIGNESHREQFRALRLEMLEQEPLAFPSDLKKTISKDNIYRIDWIKKRLFVFVENNEGKFVGTLNIALNNDVVSLADNEVSLYGMYVNEGMRRHGLGKKMIERSIAEIQRQYPNKDTIILTVNKTQEKALTFYTKFGFTIRETLVGGFERDGVKYDEYLMEYTFGPSKSSVSSLIREGDHKVVEGLKNEKTEDYGTLPTRQQADSLASKYLHDTLLHCQQVAKVMESFAGKLGENKDLWYMVGLLHDVDRDYIKKDGSKHLKVEFDNIMDEINAPILMRDDIKSHGERLTGVPVDSTIRKYLASIDELSGFLYAYSRMRPTGFEGMEVSGVKKRLKDKTFAAGVDREHVINCEKYLGVSFEEFCKEVIGFMRNSGF